MDFIRLAASSYSSIMEWNSLTDEMRTPSTAKSFSRNISNTRKRVSSDIQTLRSRFLKRLRGVWISDEAHFRVFNIASQMINNSWRRLLLEG